MVGPPPAGRRSRWDLLQGPATRSRALVAALAALAYIPLLLTHRGMVGADTKTYLYLDPGRLLSRATSMWDPNTGMGTVTHENIGYLWPMGPWYRVFAAAGVPMWVAQRLWTGTLLFAAAMGVRWLVRTLGWSGPGLAVACLAYMLSPYVLQYEARISAILMAWSALPWMIGLTIRAGRTGGWRHPALFALVAATAGAVNATCMVFAGLAAVLWLPFAVWGLGEIRLRRAAATFAKLLLLSLLAAAWWLAGLVTQSGYGLDILRYTETVEVVSRTGLAIEAVRGLGNWFFYGRDAVGPWVQAAVDYTQWGWLLAVSFAVPVLAHLGAIALRWRYRLYFSGLILVGVALAVGVHPYNQPSPLGALFKAFATGSSLGLALRSTGRAVPLVALGSAMLLGAAVDALWRRRLLVEEEEDRSRRRRTWLARSATAIVTVLVVADMAPLWIGQFVDDNLQAPEHVPAYWTQAARAVGADGKLPAPAGSGATSGPGYATRVLELPGADFAHYRWGATLDPILPGLTDRPFVSRQLQPAGGAASADLLRALDRRMQEGVLETPSLAPLARKMSVGDILLDSDLQYERFRTPQPTATWQLFDPTPAGLSAPATFGPTRNETSTAIPYTNEITLGTPTGAPDPHAVAIFGVQQPSSIVRTESATRPMILAGDGEGMVDVAAAGMLDASQPVFYAADVGSRPGTSSQLLTAGADLVVTDTNKRQAQRWGTIRDNFGYTEQAGETPLVADPTDARLPVFPTATDASRTVSEQLGGLDVRASAYGNSVSYSPAERPDQAVDGNLGTAWKVGALGNPIGQYLRIDLTQSVTTDQIDVVQPFSPPKPAPPGQKPSAIPTFPPDTRYITEVTLTFDGGHPVERDLGLASLTATGQTLTFPTTTFHRVEIRIDDTNLHPKDKQTGNGVGFAEVRIGSAPHPPTVDELLRLPTDLLDEAGPASQQHRLSLVMTRDRANPAEPFTADPEQSLARTFTLPTARSFSIGGTARVSALAPDQEVDRWLGRPDPPLTNSSGRLPGDLGARSSSALDNDPKTAWSPAIGPQEGEWLSVNLQQPLTLQHWTMQVVADGRHSVPTSLEVIVDDQPGVVVPLPAVADRGGSNTSVAVPVNLSPPATAHSRITFVIASVRQVTSKDALSGQDKILPVGIAELGLPGVSVPAAGSAVPANCRTDLLTVDGAPVGIRILGSTAAAAKRDGLAIQACGPGVDATGALQLGPGPHVVRTTPGQKTGIDLDRLVLSSAAGGRALGATPPAGAGRTIEATAPPAVVVAQGRTTTRVDIAAEPVPEPFWLVLGQSLNKGWTARITGSGGHSLGPPQLVDGYANGWLINPRADQTLTVALRWAPQRNVDRALWVSLLAALGCLAVSLLAPRIAHRSLAAPAAGRLPEWPVATRPGRAVDPPLGGRAALGAVVGCGLGATLLIGWGAGVIVAAVVAVGMLRGRWQAVPGVLGVAAIAASAIFETQQQLAHHYSLILEWPQHFSAVAGLAWTGVALVAADALVRHLRGRRPRRQ